MADMAKFAYVRYLQDGFKEILPIDKIKNFNPKNKTDFQSGKAVLAKFVDSDDDDGEYLKAQVLLLGGSEEEISDIVESKRVSASKVLDTSVEQESSDEDTCRRMQKTAKASRKIKKDDTERAKKQRLDQILQRKRGSPALMSPSTAAVVSPVLMSPSTAAKVDMDPGVLKAENLALRQLNIKLQQQLLKALKAGNKETIKTSEDIKNTEESKKNTEKIEKTAEDGDYVCLGDEIRIPKEKYKFIQMSKKPSLFAKQLAVAVWGTEELAHRSVEGKKCPRFADRAPKPPLTPSKVKAIEGAYAEFIKDFPPEKKNKETGKCRKYIGEKIQDISRAPKQDKQEKPKQDKQEEPKQDKQEKPKQDKQEQED